MRGRDKPLSVALSGGPRGCRVELRPIRRSRTKLIATILAVGFTLMGAPWAAMHYDEWNEANEYQPAARKESILLLPGLAQASRAGNTFTAASGDATNLEIDLGEISAGSSSVYPDLFRIRNAGAAPVLVSVEPVGIGDVPLHASFSGDQAPGVYTIAAGETRAVDLGLAADLVGQPGDVPGQVVVKTASGELTRNVAAKASVTSPSLETTLAALLAVENPNAGIGKLTDLVGGLVPPQFVVDGVSDGGTYGADVHLSWKAVGPLVDVRATLDGVEIGPKADVATEGRHQLVLEGKVLGVLPFSRTVGFGIDKSSPTVLLVSQALFVTEQVELMARVDDASPVTGVDFVVQRQPDPPLAEPQPTPSPSSSPTASPSPTPRRAKSGTRSSPTPSPAPAATPTPPPAPSPPPPLRVAGAYDAVTGMWVANLTLEPGTYTVWAEAVDAVGHRAQSIPQTIQVVRLVSLV